MIVLGIESSCDETAIAIIDAKNKKILANIISSQIATHQKFGGVVPELAARSHIDKIDIVLKDALAAAQLKLTDINLVAVTAGPGLIGGVVVGVSFAKALAASLNIDFIAVNHLEGHALTARFTEDNLDYPFLLFLASGGHCQILSCDNVGSYKQYGATLDDAIGEAFDKTAKLLNIPYPGGPNIEKLALNGDANKYDLPQPMRHDKEPNFSLSGLKTNIRYLIEDIKKQGNITEQIKADICASFQNIIAKMICNRIAVATEIFDKEHPHLKVKNLVFAGGVAANKYLRDKLAELLESKNYNLICPPINLCTDNAVMIAWAGYESFSKNGPSKLDFKPLSRWPLTS